MRLAARQCSTTVCGSMPKDWMSAPRPPPSMRSWSARENASPRFGSNRESLGGLMVDFAVSESAFEMSESGLSRYAAEASAWVAAVCPAPPDSGTCAPGLKSKPSAATAAPITRTLSPLRPSSNYRRPHTF